MLLNFGGDYIPDIIANAVPKVEGYDATVRSIANRCNFESEDKHIKAQLMLGNHSQKLRKFCFTVSLEEVVNRKKLFQRVDEQTGVVEGSKSINEIKNFKKNEQSLQIQLNS